MKLVSPNFLNNQLIPLQNSAYGQNLSPPLQITTTPSTTASLVIVMEDPDALSAKPWQHWLVWNITPSQTTFKEGEVPPGCAEGINDSQAVGYYGPRPPSGIHRYIFNLYALDALLNLPAASSREDLDMAMQGHVVGKTQLVGLYRAP